MAARRRIRVILPWADLGREEGRAQSRCANYLPAGGDPDRAGPARAGRRGRSTWRGVDLPHRRGSARRRLIRPEATLYDLVHRPPPQILHTARVEELRRRALELVDGELDRLRRLGP